jgi:hypothetical protein
MFSLLAAAALLATGVRAITDGAYYKIDIYKIADGSSPGCISQDGLWVAAGSCVLFKAIANGNALNAQDQISRMLTRTGDSFTFQRMEGLGEVLELTDQLTAEEGGQGDWTSSTQMTSDGAELEVLATLDGINSWWTTPDMQQQATQPVYAAEGDEHTEQVWLQLNMKSS